MTLTGFNTYLPFDMLLVVRLKYSWPIVLLIVIGAGRVPIEQLTEVVKSFLIAVEIDYKLLGMQLRVGWKHSLDDSSFDIYIIKFLVFGKISVEIERISLGLFCADSS